MSTFYYLADTKNKTLFSLGKSWHDWYNLELASLFDLKYLKIHLEDDILHETSISQAKIYAKDLFEFAKYSDLDHLLIFNDCGDELAVCHHLQYKVIKSYAFDLEWSNKHLEKSSSYQTEKNKNSMEKFLLDYPKFQKFK